MNLRQEKLDEMKRDMLLEQDLRKDFDECLEHTLNQLNMTYDDISKMKALLAHINVYDWDIDFTDLKDYV